LAKEQKEQFSGDGSRVRGLNMTVAGSGRNGGIFYTPYFFIILKVFLFLLIKKQ
jgi:hypothetical protein